MVGESGVEPGFGGVALGSRQVLDLGCRGAVGRSDSGQAAEGVGDGFALLAGEMVEEVLPHPPQVHGVGGLESLEPLRGQYGVDDARIGVAAVADEQTVSDELVDQTGQTARAEDGMARKLDPPQPPVGRLGEMCQHLIGRKAEALLGFEPRNVRLFQWRLAYSEDMDSVGKFSLSKVGVLFTTILRVWWARIRYRTPMLYYPPSGPNMVPVLRDIVFLCATRWMFKWTVFHFHAGGVSGFEGRLPAALRPLFRLAYRDAAMAIRTAVQNPEDGKLLGAKRETVVPNGVPDMRGLVRERMAAPGEPLTVLFTGVLIPSKGVRVLLEAFALVVKRGADVRLELMGRWGDADFRRECEGFLAGRGLLDRVTFLGMLRGHEKLEHFAGCDIFCFPSYFEAESFGLVLLEAMQFAKPAVTTDWRGIPSVVRDGVNGILAPVRDPGAVADALLALIDDPALRKRMGEEGRRIFVERFSLERFRTNMEAALLAAAEKQGKQA